MKVKVKRSGAIFIGITVFLGVAAANTGNNLLYILVSSMLALMLTSGISSIINLKNIEVRLIPPPEIYAHRRASFRVIARKSSVIPSFLIRVSSGIDETLFPIVDRRERETHLGFLFEKRGRVDRVRLTLSSDFPLGMFVRSMDISLDVPIVVFPAPIVTSLRILSSGSSMEGHSPYPFLTKGYEELKSIREYAGEPIKLIHWKLSAKKDELLVREMLDEEKEPVVLTLDMVEGDIETRLSKLAYLTIELIRLGYPVGLKLGDKEVPPERGNLQKLHILRELALY
ncbi:uncharacterized protein (DUF58 family) [Hydrogenivirga caldilitoris]|uniref:Uncharacterized protein (DUF58 family) n=1 Tax=Hydrogenivirga caldilitoris TaxID=246264 RepID=A0A497XPV1_9AQUI|nr:DUF58 domain-containing protein [Hydrogenivirga caldilitoris]RLJ70985.1 uncharacterized protein (DUF58 family) [Hydrogenivirga caldilitoris]